MFQYRLFEIRVVQKIYLCPFNDFGVFQLLLFFFLHFSYRKGLTPRQLYSIVKTPQAAYLISLDMVVKFAGVVTIALVSLLTATSATPIVARDDEGLSHGSNCQTSSKANNCVLTADFWSGLGQYGNSFRIFDKDCKPISNPYSINPDPKDGGRSIGSALPYTFDLQEIKPDGKSFTFNYGDIKNKKVQYFMPPLDPTERLGWQYGVGRVGQWNGICADKGNNKPKGLCYSVEFECH